MGRILRSCKRQRQRGEKTDGRARHSLQRQGFCLGGKCFLQLNYSADQCKMFIRITLFLSNFRKRGLYTLFRLCNTSQKTLNLLLKACLKKKQFSWQVLLLTGQNWYVCRFWHWGLKKKWKSPPSRFPPNRMNKSISHAAWREIKWFSCVNFQQQTANAAGYQHLYHLVGKHSDRKCFLNSCNTIGGRYQSAETNIKMA